MKSFNQKIEDFFYNNTVWVYLVLLLFVSYLLLQTIVYNSGVFYVMTFLKLCIFYIPVLLFANFRNFLQKKFGRLVFIGAWIFAFFLSPIFIFLKKGFFITHLFTKEQYNSPVDVLGDFSYGLFQTIFVMLLITEMGLLVSKYFYGKTNFSNILKKVSVDYLILGVLALISIFLGMKGVSNLEEGKSGIYSFWNTITFSVQYFLISLVYFAYYLVNKMYLIPKIFKQKGFVYYGFSIAGVVLVFYPVFVYLIRCLPMVETLKMTNYAPNINLFSSSGGAGPFFVILMSVPIIISNQWFQQNSQIAALEKEQSETELNLLKQQINPHFFFNTLNNLYALSITKDRQTPEVILLLSELMRYVIYKGKENSVSLKEEVKYIEDYIQIQQIRLHKKLEFTFEKNNIDEQLQIPPLLFITFVENAFKHGIEPAEGNCHLHLSLITKGNQLAFVCENSVEEKIESSPGIGLENLKRRMELSFPKNHEIEINSTENLFVASLKLTIA